MSVEDFKKIFYMEWGHRFFGRVIGLAYFLPFVYYLNKAIIYYFTILFIFLLGMA